MRFAAITATLALAVSLPCHAVLCTLLVTPMAFGIYSSILPSNTDTTSTVTVSCIPGASSLTTSYTLTIAGTGTGNDPVRSIPFSTSKLYYQIYKDAAYSTVWGNTAGTGVSSSVTSISSITPGIQIHTVYARMQPLQAAAAGIYIGNLTITITY
ncbi:spore coat protein U domain-containing protein [Rhodoferax sp.]|uniref:spore coat protein U domain-containing protein n=1 Tax=Rhodoferax sp. TaxID=50421 RepID=UPI00374D68B9